jgi:hypothetical protein
MPGVAMLPGEPLGTISYPCPDCKFPKMELIVHGGWPHPLYKVQCLSCGHMWVVDKDRNDYFSSLLEPGTNTQVTD